MLVVRVTTDKQKTKKKEKVTTVSVEKIDLCLEMLKSADATDVNQAESQTTQELEGEHDLIFQYRVSVTVETLLINSQIKETSTTRTNYLIPK